jgi:hypothetical protein
VYSKSAVQQKNYSDFHPAFFKVAIIIWTDNKVSELCRGCEDNFKMLMASASREMDWKSLCSMTQGPQAFCCYNNGLFPDSWHELHSGLNTNVAWCGTSPCDILKHLSDTCQSRSEHDKAEQLSESSEQIKKNWKHSKYQADPYLIWAPRWQ